MNNEILETIREVFPSKKGEITESTPVEKIAKDSMEIVELVAVLRNKYDLSIQPAEMNRIKTIGDVIKYVESHKGMAKGKSPFDSF